MVKARYVAERHEMAARHTEWGIMGGRRDPQRRRRRLALRHDAPFCPLALLLSAVVALLGNAAETNATRKLHGTVFDRYARRTREVSHVVA